MADSPAVDSGVAGALYDVDFYGNSCGSAPDIGAVEYCDDSTYEDRIGEITRYLELNE